MRLLSLFVAVLIAGSTWAQEFEAVSIKPNKTGVDGFHSRTDGALYTGTNIPLTMFVQNAYQVKRYQIEGPDWLNTERFDITARIPKDLPTQREERLAALASMNRKMLEDRFEFAAHKEQKMFPVYGLTVTKSGVKFKAGQGSGSRSDGSGPHYEGVNVTMSRLAEFLSTRVDLPVIDMTGLAGAYDMKLDWVPDANANGPVGLTLPEALVDQLGLRLENRKAPIEVLVIDHIERVPTAN